MKHEKSCETTQLGKHDNLIGAWEVFFINDVGIHY